MPTSTISPPPILTSKKVLCTYVLRRAYCKRSSIISPSLRLHYQGSIQDLKGDKSACIFCNEGGRTINILYRNTIYQSWRGANAPPLNTALTMWMFINLVGLLMRHYSIVSYHTQLYHWFRLWPLVLMTSPEPLTPVKKNIMLIFVVGWLLHLVF